MTHPYVWRDLCIRVTWPIHTWHMRLIRTWDMTQLGSGVETQSVRCAIYVCHTQSRFLILRGHFPPKSPKISGSFAQRDLQFEASYATSPRVVPSHTCDMSYVCDIPQLSVGHALHTSIDMCRHAVLSVTWVIRWRSCIGCLKLQISFRKIATDFRALWREMTSKDKASYDSTPPCMCVV